MNIVHSLPIAVLSSVLVLLGACSADKLEARLQADPQCKSVMNAKTGALMPCPGTDKEFYKYIPALNVSQSKVTQADVLQGSTSSPSLASKPILVPVECRPQLHQKSGGLMPCPAP
ncbi:hypothetical protein [Polynucleobacter sp. UK-Mo-2m-Kol15]|uniref:hypothetical protein n=1 Tax=Polynucleobacter sp. UK-Mo-2m-Kol15 TaxID=2576916 RepID=UPI001C0CB8E3|nr:hypothetical protein [Polynucleobacter sp. UK-Mo-2m-Kol15]MBU3575742.1 hypothetical protein [Polynucleobacter sp. UK-Mo-2m-Kol15]